MLKEERMRILEMLKEGIISVDDAEKLLNAVDRGEALPTKKLSFKMLKIEIDSEDGDEVRLQIPVEFAKLIKGKKFSSNLDMFKIDIDALLDLVNTGAVGELININSDGNKIIIKVE